MADFLFAEINDKSFFNLRFISNIRRAYNKRTQDRFVFCEEVKFFTRMDNAAQPGLEPVALPSG